MDATAANYARLASYALTESYAADYQFVAYAALAARVGSNDQLMAERNSTAGSIASITPDTPTVIYSVFDGANHTMHIDGVAATPAASTGTFGSNLVLTIGGGAVPWKGKLSELIVLKTDPAGNTQLADYLNSKWGF
jgi:hypothetical protein